MRIIMVAEGRYPDFVGGAETVVHHLGRELTNRGHEVHTLTRKPRSDMPNYEMDEGIHTHRYPGPGVGSYHYPLYPLFSFLGARRRFAELNCEVHFDAIVVNDPFPAAGVLSSESCASIGRKVYIFHSATHLEFRAAVPMKGALWDASLTLPMACLKRIEKYALQKSDTIITLSQYMNDQVVRFHNEAEGRIEIIPGGVDTKAFSPIHDLEEKRRIREAFSVPQNAFVLFVAKRLYGEMGLENIIDAVQLLDEKNVRLLIAGDGPLRMKLRDRINRKGLASRVLLLGNVPHHQMASFYRLADLFVSTRAEPFGLVMLEALACGLPVLSVPAGGAVEILGGLSKSLLFKDTSSAAMASLILKYINSPEELGMLPSECRRSVECNYTWSAFAERIEQLLDREEVVF